MPVDYLSKYLKKLETGEIVVLQAKIQIVDKLFITEMEMFTIRFFK